LFASAFEKHVDIALPCVAFEEIKDEQSGPLVPLPYRHAMRIAARPGVPAPRSQAGRSYGVRRRLRAETVRWRPRAARPVDPNRLCVNACGHDRLASIRDHDDITGLDVRRRVFQEAEIIASCVMEPVDGHRASSIDRLSAAVCNSRVRES
jgi:hypothetical protein